MWWSSQGKSHIVAVLIGREMDLPSLKNDITTFELGLKYGIHSSKSKMKGQPHWLPSKDFNDEPNRYLLNLFLILTRPTIPRPR